MRILFFAVYFDFRGEPTNLADEVKSVVKNYPDTEFVVYTVGPFNKKNQIIRYSKNILWIQRLDLKNLKIMWLFTKDMIKIFTKFKPNVIHAVYVVESIIMGIMGKIFFVPSISHGRGMDLNYYPFRRLRSFILAKISCILNKKIITVSKNMKYDVLRLNVSNKKVEYIYDGLDFSAFNPKNRKINTNNKRFEIIHAGRFSPEKNQDLIIEVCKDLRDNNYDFHFTFIGYGPLEKQLKVLIKEYNLENWITMGGFVEHANVHKYFEKADLYVQPSTSEGMPKSVYEAMSMELPVVMTKVGGMSELNIKPGIILIEPNNKKQLYDGILSFINNSESSLIGGKKNREYVLRNFNWDLHAKKLYQIYYELTKRKK